MSEGAGPHQGQPVLRGGAPLGQARAALIMLHGRGATAEDILSVSETLRRADFAYLAPQARDSAWYPNSFLTSIEGNEPGLSSGLAVIAGLLAEVGEQGIGPERTILLGFSQGACLMLEFAARNARRYGGLMGLSGGLIGPDGTPRNYAGNLAGTPVFLGCSDVDPYIPRQRVEESAVVLNRLGGEVTMRLYAGMEHTINLDEVRYVQQVMDDVLDRP